MIDFTAYQDVECVYPMSGQYGRAPRGLYYALLLFVILLRRQDWLTAGAAAACLTYGGSAAIHALILAPILSLGTTAVPNGVVQLSNSTQIKVEAALVTDLDSDATLAIVGAGFLIVMPMAIWSAQFRHSGAIPILVMWILLMFIGMVCCMTILYSVDGSSTGPLRQFRFCSLGYNDTLPFSGNSINIVNNSWNDTVWSYFSNQDSSSPGCFYPCLNASGLLRQSSDARVIEFLDINPSKPIYWGIELISAIVYGWVPLSIAFSFALLVLRLRGYTSAGWDFDSSERVGWKAKFSHYTLWAINVYGKILTPFVFVAFLVWSEWIIYYDLQSEPMQFVGQWAPLVGAGLVFVAAVVGKYWPEFVKLWRAYQQRRIRVRGCDMSENISDSIKYALRDRQNVVARSAWGQGVGFTFLQGSDMD
jgi:hypothetical protein